MRSGVLAVDGCELAWSADGAGKPILLIHGTAACVWGDLFQQAARCGMAIQYDRRGFGASRASSAESLSRHADDAAALLDGLSARGAIVVGWSIGGVIAAELAVRHPGMIAGLVLLEPPLWAKRNPDLNLLNGVALSIVVGLIAGADRGGRRFSRWVFRERNGGNSLDTVDHAVRNQIEANAAAVGTEIRAGTGEHLTPEMLGGIRLPTIVFAGDRGQKFLGESAARMAGAIPAARLQILPGASHFLQLERAEVIGEALKAFTGSGGNAAQATA